MRKTISSLFLVFACTLLVGCDGCTSKKTGTVEGPPPLLKGERETRALVEAMQAISDTQVLAKKLELLERVQAAGKDLVALKLTEAEEKALEDKYGAKKAELHKKIEDIGPAKKYLVTVRKFDNGGWREEPSLGYEGDDHLAAEAVYTKHKGMGDYNAVWERR